MVIFHSYVNVYPVVVWSTGSFAWWFRAPVEDAFDTMQKDFLEREGASELVPLVVVGEPTL
jgi:hypothetical protein